VSDATRRPASVVLGLDVGTTGTKVVAFGLDRPWRHVTIREYPLLEPEPGQQVQDPVVVLDAILDALATCVAACADAEVVALAVSSAMHGLVGLDDQRRPLTPLITWADARATEEARALRHSALGRRLHQRTGTPIHPMSPLMKLQWTARHEPRLAAEVRTWLGMKDLVLLELTGELVTERSSASGSGLLELATGAWYPDALELAGITADQLPELTEPTAIRPLSAEAAARTGLNVGLPVVLGAADGPLGNLGTGAVRPGQVGLSLGTSGAARMMVAAPPAQLDEALFCYALTEDAYVVGGAVSNGGIVVRWAGDSLAPDVQGTAGQHRDAALLELAATAPAGCDGLVMLPYLLSERAPLWDPDLPGAYLGLSRGHGRAHLLRAAVEGVSLQLSAIVDQLERLEPVTEVRVTGGAFRATLWREVLAAALGRPITVVGQAEGSALGAAALGLVALGRASDLPAGLAALAPPDHAADATTDPDSAMVAVYDQTRQTIATTVAQLSAVGRLFAAAPSRSRSRPTPRRLLRRPEPALARLQERGVASSVSRRDEPMEREAELVAHVLVEAEVAFEVPVFQRPGVGDEEQVVRDQLRLDRPEDPRVDALAEDRDEGLRGLDLELLDPVTPRVVE
jgi:gluconokinase